MEEITINLRALTEDARTKIMNILEAEQKIIPDDDNYTAMYLLGTFKE